MNKRTLLALGVVAAAGAVAWRRLSLRETLDWATVPKPGRLLDIDGYRVHHVEQGAGPAIVLIHGFGEDHKLRGYWSEPGTRDEGSRCG